MVSKCSNTSKRALLCEVASYPEAAYVKPKFAAALLDTSPAVLANWRNQRRGPPYSGHGDFVRYQIKVLNEWMAQRASEITTPVKRN